MRTVPAYISLFAVILPSIGACASNGSMSVYRSLDGRTELIASKSYYYLGPSNHPDGEKFLEEYGQPLGRMIVNGVQCISLGVFKIAKFERKSASCQNVNIKKNAKKGEGGVGTYVGSCFELDGNGCAVNTESGKPALVYSYKIDAVRGVTEINVTGDQLTRTGSTLVLASGPSIIE